MSQSPELPDVDRLEALARAATPGPWAYQENSDAYTHIIRPAANPGRIIASGAQTSAAEGEANGRLIAACNPAAVLALIALARRAQPEGEDLRAEIEKLISYKHCMSYNDSYFTEPAGMLKRLVFQLDRLLGASAKAKPEGEASEGPHYMLDQFVEANSAPLSSYEPEGEAPQAVAHAEARECSSCGHIGINDSSDTLAACHNCDWSGPSPAEDHCPGCAQGSCMGAACPKCGAIYKLLAEAKIAAPAAQHVESGAPVQPQNVSDERMAFDAYWSALESDDATEWELEICEQAAWQAWQARPRHCLSLPLSAYPAGTTIAAQQAAAPGALAGYQTVPSVATKDMLHAGMRHFHDKCEPATKAWECYRDMLKAAPCAPGTPEAPAEDRHPLQPLVEDARGTVRFKANAIVVHLTRDKLNDLASMDFSTEDREQLAQLIGYSLGGFAELSYVTDETYDRAAAQPVVQRAAQLDGGQGEGDRHA